MQSNDSAAVPHAALLASPGMGHVVPAIELGKRLSSNHGFHVSIFILESGAASSAQSQFLNSQGCDQSLLTVIPLPTPDISDLVDPDAHIVVKIDAMMRQTMPALRSKIESMNHKPTALIVDLFGAEALPIADEFNMLKYVLIASNARFVSLALFYPTLDKTAEDEHVNQKKPLSIPGCKPVRFDDTLDAYQLNRTDPVNEVFIRLGLVMPTTDGILVNTWEDLEPNSLKSLRDPKLLGGIARVPIYPIGPLTRPVEPSESGKHPVMDWLDKQPTESVIYISFGSGGTLTSKQMTELAWGLELSQQRFVWVVRPPTDGGDACSAFFAVNNGGTNDVTPEYLPEGFMGTRSRGLVIPMWAPQTEVLAHPAVGAFMTHCGWSSALESITSGVPMIAWPLYAEQRLNAAELTDEIRVAVRSEEGPVDGVISRVEIEAMVNKVMLGGEIRENVKKLKDSGDKTLIQPEGSSYGSLAKLALDCVLFRSGDYHENRARGA